MPHPEQGHLLTLEHAVRCCQQSDCTGDCGNLSNQPTGYICDRAAKTDNFAKLLINSKLNVMAKC